MIRLKRVALALLLIAVFSCKEAQKEKVRQPETETIAVETVVLSTYQDLAGTPVELVDYKGKKVLVNYWATWCRPCIEEMPDLLQAQDMLADDNYVFLLASDESTKKISKFKLDRSFDFKFIKYNGTYAELKIDALPVTFIYNEAGEEVFRFDGAMEWNSPEVIQKLKNLE